jgi:DNA-binding CsgD family transcriptional regulator
MRATESTADVHRVLESTFQDLGFEQFSYFVLRPPHDRPRPKILSTYPDEWKLRYSDLEYSYVDRMHTAASSCMFPLRWDEIYTDPHTTKKQRLVFDEAKEFGVKNGLTVPIHGPAGGTACLSLSGNLKARQFEDVWKHYYDHFTLIAAYTHEAILKQLDAGDSYEPIRLTDRERECLLWTSRGKTTWEIGQILKISENTVLFHVNRSMRKLKVFSKHHAVVKAIMLGLIVPEL